MPYIDSVDRKRYDELIDKIVNEIRGTNYTNFAGQLNYIISSLLLRVYKKNDICYSILNEIIGLLECSKLEVYRRFVSPYEDKKIKQNGDIF